MGRAVERGGRAVAAWALYDFANSAFTTLVVTFVYSTFFTSMIASDPVTGTGQWSLAVTVTALVVAAMSPILGAVADRGGHRKRFLLWTTVACIGATAALYMARPGQVLLALSLFIVANVAFEMANVFYNAFLPDVAPPSRIGRVSGYGWSLGYVGGLLAMVVAMVTLVNADRPWYGFTLTDGANIRATNLLVALWYAVFSVPLFLFVAEDRSRVDPPGTPLLRSALGQLAVTFRGIQQYRQVVRLLMARLVYNDGLITIFAFGGIYAAGTFGFTMQEIMVFGIMLNVAAGIGAFVMGYLDDRVGGKTTIQLSLLGLGTASVLAVVAPSRAYFWTASIVVGLFAGPNQSASRSLMGRLVPPDKESEFFGFFALSGKATAFLGPFLLGRLTELFDSQRAGVAVVVVFFVIGGLLLVGLDEDEGIAFAGRG